jgi:hypothetical protein
MTGFFIYGHKPHAEETFCAPVVLMFCILQSNKNFSVDSIYCAAFTRTFFFFSLCISVCHVSAVTRVFKTHKICQGLLLHPVYVPEKVGINQK